MVRYRRVVSPKAPKPRPLPEGWPWPQVAPRSKQEKITKDTTIHMVKDRKGAVVTTRCGVTLKLKAGQGLPDIWVTGWEKEVVCPQCQR